ncbi:MAG: hypothetical protein QM770_16465 [Tepidisphaeraceae bacterium]
MLIQIVRALFILLVAAVGYAFIQVDAEHRPLGEFTWLLMAMSVTVGVIFVCIDILSPRKKLQVFAGTFLGLLVGVLVAWAFSFVIPLVVDQAASRLPESLKVNKAELASFLTLLVGCVSVYLSISFVLQTKDDFRFIVPYVEFAKQTKGPRPMLLDTSALIDGRIADVGTTGIFDVQLIVPRFVLNELQQVADSGDRLKRNRGRRGLDVLSKLQKTVGIDVIIYEASHHDTRQGEGVDQLLMSLAKELGARVLTTDFNLNKVAKLTGVDVINLNDLANALKPEVLPGEPMTVRLIRPGEESNQGVGFLDDGTMVVVEHGRSQVGQEVEFIVTNTRQTSAGRMIFGRIPSTDVSEAPDGPPAPRPSDRNERSERRGGRRGGHDRDRVD